MKFFLLVNVKMRTIVGILTFMSGQNSILGLYEPKNSGLNTAIINLDCLTRKSGAPVAQWVTCWPTDVADPGSSPARNDFFFC